MPAISTTFLRLAFAFSVEVITTAAAPSVTSEQSCRRSGGGDHHVRALAALGQREDLGGGRGPF